VNPRGSRVVEGYCEFVTLLSRHILAEKGLSPRARPVIRVQITALPMRWRAD
jgi:hypothetical protein